MKETIENLEEVEGCILEDVVDINGKQKLFVVPKDRESTRDDITTQNWAKVYDISYANIDDKSDLEFNTDLWVSSYTGIKISEVEMKEWVNSAVLKILSSCDRNSINIKRVLEIGCGSGLLMYPLLDHCDEYVGLDSSKEGIQIILRNIKDKNISDKIKLFHCDASKVADLEIGKFDLIIINSVTQYFPSLEYTLKLFDSLSSIVSDRALIFVGDVRSTLMQESFFADTLLDNLPDNSTVENFKNKLEFKINRDPETIFDPRFFQQLPCRFSFIDTVETQLKNGIHDNEMNNFRFDVEIVCKSSDTREKDNLEKINSKDIVKYDWAKNEIDLESLKTLVFDTNTKCIQIINLPNERLIRSKNILHNLRQTIDTFSIDEFKELLKVNIANADSIHPQSCLDIANNKYYISTDWNYNDPEGQMQIFISLPGFVVDKSHPMKLRLSQCSNKISNLKASDYEMIEDKIVSTIPNFMDNYELRFISQRLYKAFT